MPSIVILTKNKTVYVHLDEIVKNGELVVRNTLGRIVFRKKLTDSFYEIIVLKGQQSGKYWLQINSDILKAKKTFQL